MELSSELLADGAASVQQGAVRVFLIEFANTPVRIPFPIPFSVMSRTWVRQDKTLSRCKLLALTPQVEK